MSDAPRRNSLGKPSRRVPAASYLYLKARPYKAYWWLNEWFALTKGRKLTEAILSDLASRRDLDVSLNWVIQWIQWTGQAFVVPRQRSLGNRVVVGVGPADEQPVLILKIANSSSALRSLKRQQQQLAAIHADERLAPLRMLVPRPLIEGVTRGQSYFVERALPGLPADRLLFKSSSTRLLTAAADVIRELHQRTATSILVDQSIIRGWVTEPLRRIQSAVEAVRGAGYQGEAFRLLNAELDDALRGRTVTVSCIHGDFWLGNVLVRPEDCSITGVVDWDRTGSGQLPAHDITHLLLITRGNTDPRRDFGEIIESFVGGAGWRSNERDILQRGDLPFPVEDEHGQRLLVLLCWIRRTAAVLDAIESAPTETWIRRNVDVVLSLLERRANVSSRGAESSMRSRTRMSTHTQHPISRHGAEHDSYTLPATSSAASPATRAVARHIDEKAAGHTFIRSSRTIIVVTDRVLFPVRTGNQARIIALIRSLRDAGFSVVLLTRPTFRVSRHPGIRATLRTRALADRVISVDAPHFVIGSPLAYDCSPFLEPLSRAVRQFKPVAVIAEYIWMAPCLDGVPAGTLRVLDTHDLMHVRKAMYEGQPEGAWVECSREEEQSLLAKADVIMAIQRHEAEAFRAMVPTKTVVHVPHCCDLQAIRPSSVACRDVVTVVGAWNRGNLVGIRAFVDESWPVIRRLCPSAELRIYGDVALYFDSPIDGVHPVGHVPNLTDAYRGAKVVVNPVTLGTGLKVKSVEALAYGKALVTTSCGADGLEEGRDHAFLLEDDSARFGEAVARLLRDDDLRSGLERRALAFAARSFSPAAALREFLAVIPTGGS